VLVPKIHTDKVVVDVEIQRCVKGKMTDLVCNGKPLSVGVVARVHADYRAAILSDERT